MVAQLPIPCLVETNVDVFSSSSVQLHLLLFILSLQQGGLLIYKFYVCSTTKQQMNVEKEIRITLISSFEPSYGCPKRRQEKHDITFHLTILLDGMYFPSNSF